MRAISPPFESLKQFKSQPGWTFKLFGSSVEAGLAGVLIIAKGNLKCKILYMQ